MQLRFFKGINPLKYKKRMQFYTPVLQSTFRRVNLSLAGCSSAEPTSVLVQMQNSNEKTTFTTCLKSQPRSILEVFDLTGRKLWKEILPPWSTEQHIKLKIAAGIYTVKITSNKQQAVQKMIVQ